MAILAFFFSVTMLIPAVSRVAFFGNQRTADQDQAWATGAAAGEDGQLGFFLNVQHCGKFFLIAIGFQQLAAVLLGHIAGQRDLCTLAILVEEQHVTTVIDCDRHEQRHFALFHFQLEAT